MDTEREPAKEALNLAFQELSPPSECLIIEAYCEKLGNLTRRKQALKSSINQARNEQLRQVSRLWALMQYKEDENQAGDFPPPEKIIPRKKNRLQRFFKR